MLASGAAVLVTPDASGAFSLDFWKWGWDEKGRDRDSQNDFPRPLRISDILKGLFRFRALLTSCSICFLFIFWIALWPDGRGMDPDLFGDKRLYSFRNGAGVAYGQNCTMAKTQFSCDLIEIASCLLEQEFSFQMSDLKIFHTVSAIRVCIEHESH